ncbi:MAG: hypothetical protein Q4E26_03980, partial [Prevotellaceae bacterium]|nr:hypothetical protein [Prevotellaceae bacterium]
CAQRVTEDQLVKRAKLYVSQQKDKIGKNDRVINLKLAKMYATDRTVKVVYTKENTAFATLFPEQTEGRFKTEAQENRFVVREYMIWKAATDALASASFASVIRNDLYTWLVDVVSPDGTELDNFDFKTLSVRKPLTFVAVRCLQTSEIISLRLLSSVRCTLCLRMYIFLMIVQVSVMWI